MFSAEEFKLMRKNCPGVLDSLLKQLSIPQPDFGEGDTFKEYDKLDADIVKNLCRQLKAKTIVEGCRRLLNIGGQRVGSNDDEDDLMLNAVNYEVEIMRGARALPPPEPPPELRRPVYIEETDVAPVPMIFGAFFTTLTFAYNLTAEVYFPAITVMGTIIGIGGLILGLRGEIRLRKIKLPPPPPDEQEPMTIIDVKNSLESLKLIKKILHAM